MDLIFNSFPRCQNCWAILGTKNYCLECGSPEPASWEGRVFHSLIQEMEAEEKNESLSETD